ncbi:hypothetical protein R2F61_07415 [Mollicutes bacterium LVI A0078]|nr:hypothetical protein R2F61_07415 [Mollicutes bacterium LVI A0078]
MNRCCSIEPGYTRCLMCGKKIKSSASNKCAPICDDEQCNDDNYTCISDLYN